LYQFDKLGEDGDEVTSTDYPDNGVGALDLPSSFFSARSLENLVLVDEMESLGPIVDAQVANVLQSDSPQIFTACGSRSRSTVRMMRHGLEVEELVSAPLPFEPNGVWATKLTESGE